MPPVRFQLKLYRHYHVQHILSGLLTPTQQVFFSAADVASFLRLKTPSKWAHRQADCRYGEVLPDPIRQNVPLISFDKLRQWTRERRHRTSNDTFLKHIIQGSDRVHYEGLQMGEHILKVCPCVSSQGIPFIRWAEKEMTRLAGPPVWNACDSTGPDNPSEPETITLDKPDELDFKTFDLNLPTVLPVLVDNDLQSVFSQCNSVVP